MDIESVLLLTPLDARRHHLICKGVYLNKEIHTTCINTYNLLKASEIDVIYHEFTSNNLANIASMASLAQNLASEAEYLHSKIKQKYFHLDKCQHSWDFLNLYFILLTAQIYKSQSSNISKIINSRNKFSVIWPNFNQDYHFDSIFLKKIAFDDFSKLEKINKIFVARNQEEENAYKKSLAILSLQKLEGIDTIVSIPTISENDKKEAIKYLNSHSNRNAILDIKSPFWDTDTGFNRLDIADQEEINIRNLNYEDDYKSLLRNVFKAVGCTLPKEQEQRFIERSLFQIDFYSKISTLSKLKKIIVTNHDGGLLGPLISLAEKTNAELNYFPHSATHNLPLKITNNCNLHFSYFNKNINYSSLTFSKPNFFCYTQKNQCKKNATKNALIILNDLSEYGFTKSSLSKHIENINEIGGILTTKGYTVTIRDKPSSPYKNLLEKIIQYQFSDTDIDLEQLSKNTQICVAYEAATSAMNFFIKRDVLTILATDRKQSNFEYSIIPSGAHIRSISNLAEIIPFIN